MTFENSSRKSDSQSTSGPFTASSLLINLMPLPGLAAPRFPTFSELVSESVGESVSEIPSKPSGLFSAMLGDPQVLYHDLLDDPSRYEEGVSSLLQGLISGQQELSEISASDMELLDRAVLDYNQPKRPKPEAQLSPAPKRIKRAAAEPEHRPPQIPGLPENVEPYWWLK